MAIEFIQKRTWQTQRKFTLFQDRIVVESTSWRKINKFEVRLENLGFEIQYQADNTTYWKIALRILIATTVFSFLGVLGAYGDHLFQWISAMVIGFVMTTWVYFRPYQDDLFLTGGQTNLVLFRNLPTETAVFDFIEKIKGNYNSLLKEKYTAFTRDTPESDYYARLGWLLDNGIISSSEHTEYKVTFDIQKLLL